MSGRRGLPRAGVAWIFSVLAILPAAAAWLLPPKAPVQDTEAALLALTSPPGTSFAAEEAPVISPNGRRVAFVAHDTNGTRQLYARDKYTRAFTIADGEPIAGSEGASLPFWSPDSASIGFFAQGKLKTVHLATRRVQTLAPASGARGGTWSKDDVIVFVPSPIAGPYRIAAAGGAATRVVSEGGEFPRGWFPSFLPDGRHFLVFVIAPRPEDAGVYVASLDSPRRTRLVAARSNAVYAAPGYILYGSEGTLLAHPFDADRLELTGTAVPLTTAVGLNPVTNQALFSVSASGTLVFFSTAAGQSEIAWMDRSGTQIGPALQRGAVLTVALSPDATEVIYDLADSRSATFDLWQLAFARGVPARRTFNAGSDVFPVWSPDGRRIAYASVREGPPWLYALDAAGSREETRLLKANLPTVPSGWSADGKMLFYTMVNPLTAGGDIYVLPPDGGEPKAVVNTEWDERYGTLSPDGRWLAYVSNRSGRYEVYVSAFPGGGLLRQVSNAGGLQPEWRRDGRELFYLAPDDMLMAVDTSAAGASFDHGAPAPLFSRRMLTLEIQPTARTYSPTADGRRFLIASATQQARSEPIRVALNWLAALRR